MRWRRVTSVRDPYQWHPWFAWHPVCIRKLYTGTTLNPTVTRTWIWLERVERRGLLAREYRALIHYNSQESQP